METQNMSECRCATCEFNRRYAESRKESRQGIDVTDAETAEMGLRKFLKPDGNFRFEKAV
jgi:hypothetical protein